jgi:hypothetical protein
LSISGFRVRPEMKKMTVSGGWSKSEASKIQKNTLETLLRMMQHSWAVLGTRNRSKFNKQTFFKLLNVGQC